MEYLHFRLRIYLSLFLAVMVLGTFGFMYLEGLSLADAFYFSIVTIATVGYGDIHPVTPIGKGLAVLLIVMGVGTFLGVVANATEMVLQKRETKFRQEKMNMVIGLFFSEIGTRLLKIFVTSDRALEQFRNDLIITADWTSQDFAQAILKNTGFQHTVEILPDDMETLRVFLSSKKDFMVRLLEHPALLEHETFTNLLRAIFHLTEELSHREAIASLPKSDTVHLQGDIKRVYRLLISQWILYMKHLKNHYPYLFSLAVRTNPFDRQASPVVSE